MLVTATVFLVAVAQVDLSRDSTNATDYRIKVSWGQCLIGIKAIVQKVLYPSELSFWDCEWITRKAVGIDFTS